MPLVFSLAYCLKNSISPLLRIAWRWKASFNVSDSSSVFHSTSPEFASNFTIKSWSLFPSLPSWLPSLKIAVSFVDPLAIRFPSTEKRIFSKYWCFSPLTILDHCNSPLSFSFMMYASVYEIFGV